MQIKLTAVNTLPGDPDQNILLFLLPKKASLDFQVEAWKKLNPGPNNGTSSITFGLRTQVRASTSAEPSGTLAGQGASNQTAITPIVPGQVLGCFSDDADALRLGPSLNDQRVTSDQSGLVNNTNALLIDIDWLVDGSEVVRIANVNQGQIVTFEIEPTIYVMAASQPVEGHVGGFNFTVQDVSPLTAYNIPPGATDITMTWSRAGGSMGGADIFTFTSS